MEEDEEEEEEAHTLPFGDCHCRESYGRGMSGWGGQTSHNLPSSRLLRLPPRARGSSLSLSLFRRALLLFQDVYKYGIEAAEPTPTHLPATRFCV